MFLTWCIFVCVAVSYNHKLLLLTETTLEDTKVVTKICDASEFSEDLKTFVEHPRLLKVGDYVELALDLKEMMETEILSKLQDNLRVREFNGRLCKLQDAVKQSRAQLIVANMLKLLYIAIPGGAKRDAIKASRDSIKTFLKTAGLGVATPTLTPKSIMSAFGKI